MFPRLLKCSHFGSAWIQAQTCPQHRHVQVIALWNRMMKVLKCIWGGPMGAMIYVDPSHGYCYIPSSSEDPQRRTGVYWPLLCSVRRWHPAVCSTMWFYHCSHTFTVVMQNCKCWFKLVLSFSHNLILSPGYSMQRVYMHTYIGWQKTTVESIHIKKHWIETSVFLTYTNNPKHKSLIK